MIGLFLKKEVPPFLTLEETLYKIKEQEGIIYIPHPFDRLRRAVINYKSLLSNICYVDIIEIFNSRTVFREDNLKAYNFAVQHNKLSGAGSDAHTRYEIGNVIIEMEDFKDKDDFLAKLKHGTIKSKYSSIFVHIITKIVKRIRKGEKVANPYR